MQKILALVVLAVASLSASTAGAEGTKAKVREPRGIINLPDTIIIQRVPRPHVVADIARRPMKLTLVEGHRSFVPAIARAIARAPF